MSGQNGSVFLSARFSGKMKRVPDKSFIDLKKTEYDSTHLYISTIPYGTWQAVSICASLWWQVKIII